MSFYADILKDGGLDNTRILKTIEMGRYKKDVVLTGLGKNCLGTGHLIEVLKGVQKFGNLNEKNFLSEEIVRKISLKGVSRKKKLFLISKSSHNKFLARRIDKTIKWDLMETKSIEEAVRDSDYNFYILISAIKTGKLTTRTRFESIAKVKGNGKINSEVAKMIIETNNWGKMGLKDCCMAIKLSGGDDRIARAVIEKKMNLPDMLAREMIDALELSDKHILIVQAIQNEVERRKSLLIKAA